MSWEDAKEMLKNTGGSGNYIRLKDGDEVTGVFVGEPVTYYKKFKEQTKYKEPGSGRSPKFSITFAIQEGDEFKPYILEQGIRFLRTLTEMQEEYGFEMFFKIKRKGSTKDDTEYHVLPKEPLTDAQKAAISAIRAFSVGVSEDSGDEAPPHTDDDMPQDVDSDENIPF